MVPDGWHLKSMHSVLERVAKPIAPEPAKLYREIGIRSHGKGIFHKEPVSGESLGDKRVFEVVPDCLVLNIVFAWEQAVARTTQAEAGMIASHRFPMYRPKDDSCDIDYLTYFFKSKRGKRLLELASPGGAGRNKTLGQDEFSKLTFLMPSVDEQRRIAAILSTWDGAIRATEALMCNAKAQKQVLIARLLKGARDWESVRLGDLAKLNPKNELLPPDTRVSFIPMDAVSDEGQLTRLDDALYSDVASGHPSFKNSDVLVAKITPCFENGKGAFVKGLSSPVGFGSTEFHVLRARDTWSAKFIYHVTCSQQFRRRGELNMQGSAGQKRVPADYLRKYKFFIPRTREEQARVVKALDGSDAILQKLKGNLHSLQEQKRGLMQQLLTGKGCVRLISPS